MDQRKGPMESMGTMIMHCRKIEKAEPSTDGPCIL